MIALEVVFWVAAALLLYTQLGYPLLLAAFARAREPTRFAWPDDRPLPLVSVIVAAYAEESVIGERVANLRALAFPRERLEIIVACDGSPDRTAQRARYAGADLVLELPRGGKVRAQDAAVERAKGNFVAFTDANARWQQDALTQLVAP